MAGIDWDAMPVWTVKRSAAFLGISVNRLRNILKDPENRIPEGAPELTFETENKRIYIDADGVREFTKWIEENPAFLTVGGARGGGPGTRKYFIYLDEEQATQVGELFSDVRFDVANKPKPKSEDDDEATEGEVPSGGAEEYAE